MSYAPIGDYGIIGDTQSAALISSAGSLDWLCLPRFDSAAMFLRILDDERGGRCAIRLEGAQRSRRRYLPRTNILETRFETSSGALALTDFMPVRQRADTQERGQDVEAAHRVVRLLRCSAGEAECRIEVRPTFEYAQERPKAIRRDERRVMFLGTHHALYAQLPPGFDVDPDGVVTATVRLRAGEAALVVLTWAEPERDVRAVALKDAEQELETTRAYWEQWSRGCTYEGDHRELLMRSALGLKLLIYEPTGAIVAAPTASLPEALGGGRNWDYRFTWLRDASLTLAALMNLGYFGEAHDFFHFLHRSLPQDAAKFQIMYRVGGEESVGESELNHLDGYRGSRPVRIGNGAADQTQLDIFGELLHCVYLYWSHHGFEHRGESFPRDFWPLVRSTADYVAQHWRRPGSGIWEMRGLQREFTHAKGLCWVALDRALKLAQQHGVDGDLASWERARDEVRRDMEEHGYNRELGAYTQSYGSTAMDASLLRLPLMGVIDPGSERMRGTIAAIERQLVRNGLVYRYRQAESNDGLTDEEGTFTACAFWLAENYALQGRVDEAERLFAHTVSFANDLGLMSEELDPDSDEQLGNFPQAFTHVGLINAAVRIQAARRGWRPAISGILAGEKAA